MSSERRSASTSFGGRLGVAWLCVLAAAVLAVSTRAAAPRFFPDDPIAVDRDSDLDADGAKPLDLSEGFDMIENSFGPAGDPAPIHALNVNTLDEVPDSSWFTNRLGARPMSVAELTRGPDTVGRLDATEWVVVAGKGPAGFQPGFRAVDARDTRARPQWYQLELDTAPFPELATGAEMIGTTIYHAIGFNVVDTYIVYVDPRKVRIAPTATLRDASGRRRLTQGDLDEIFRLGARRADGTYRMTASRFVEGEALGNFRHFGTRPDDPNDIHPHEHRRELRANRVFSAWINHDDSRALNTLDMLVTENGRKHIRHYMFDFGSILGSSPDRRWSGHEYLLERRPTLAGLASLGFWLQPWQRIAYPARPLRDTVGRIQGDVFDPEAWKPEYPNQAFSNMQPADAFWGARIVAAFTDEMLTAVVRKAEYSDPRTTEFLTDVLRKRRGRIARVWLNVVNPVVNFQLAADGTLTFQNAAIDAGAATAGAGYALQWSRFDNLSDTHTAIGTREQTATPAAKAPREIAGAEYVAVTVTGEHAQHAAWAQPVRAYFRRESIGWKTVGLERLARK